MKQRKTRNAGVALILVLWVILFLTMIAHEFVYDVRTEVMATKNCIDSIKAYYYALGGINIAFLEIVYPNLTCNHLDMAGKLVFRRKATHAEEEEDQEIRAPNRQNIRVGDGFVSYEIIDEERKININNLNRTALVKVIKKAGVEIGTTRDIVVDSILDWIDKDNEHRLNGAENDYYMNLPTPYKCKNGPLDTFEELILIRGMTQELLYGYDNEDQYELMGNENIPLHRLITVIPGATSGVNKNTASLEVLEILYGDKKASEIIEGREDGNGICKGGKSQKSSYFCVEATGSTKESGIATTIKVLVKRHGKSKGEILQWIDIKPYFTSFFETREVEEVEEIEE